MLLTRHVYPCRQPNTKRPNDSVASVITFESATDADFEELLALRLAAMRPSLERLGRFDAERSRERFRASFDARFTRHICIDGRRVGFVALKRVADGLLLDHLYIHPVAQGRRIGGGVLATVIAAADAEGRALFVTALRDSDSNRFYRRYGFVVVSESDWDVHYRRLPAAPCSGGLLPAEQTKRDREADDAPGRQHGQLEADRGEGAGFVVDAADGIVGGGER
jgi:GNAT superfamily N-acetyltransferase